jgi:hypothetical protein
VCPPRSIMPLHQSPLLSFELVSRQCYIRFPVKKAQQPARSDSADRFSTSSPPRRSQQTLDDLISMNTNDHAQRSMQRQGSFVLLNESKEVTCGRPLFTSDVTAPPASAVYTTIHNTAAVSGALSASPDQSPRGIATTMHSPVRNSPLRPHTAHPSQPRVQAPFRTVNITPTAPNVMTMTNQVPDGSRLSESSSVQSPGDPSCIAQQQSSQAAASPLSSSRSKRYPAAATLLSPNFRISVIFYRPLTYGQLGRES